MPSQESLLAIRKYASSLSPDERKGFIDKFNSIKDDDTKIDTLASRIGGLSQQKSTPQFSSIGDAIAANRLAEIEQARAVRGTSGMNLAVNTAGKTLLDFLGTPSRVTSQLAMDVATGQNTGTKLSNLGKTLTAQKESSWGDVLRAGDVPNMPATVGGFLGDVAVSPGGIQVLKGAGNLTIKGVQNIGKGIAGSSFGQMLRKLPVRLSDTKSAEFANKIRQAYTNTKSEAVKKFGSGLDELAIKNPDKKVNLFENNNIQNIVTDPDLTTEASAVFKKTPILRDIISGKRSPEVTAKEAQDIANYLQFKVPQSVKSQHLDIIDMINEVKSSQANAFPTEMSSLRKEYARIAEPFKDLKSKLKLQNALQSIDAGFGGAVQRQQLKELFKDNPELLKEMGGYKGAGKLLSGIKWSAGVGATAIGGKAVFDAATKQ